MEKIDYLFDHPKLRPGVLTSMTDGDMNIDYRDQGCTISSSDPASMHLLMIELQEGACTQEQLLGKFPALAAEIPGLISELDRLGLLTESAFPKTQNLISGQQFGRKLRQTSNAMFSDIGSSTLYGMMLAGKATKEMLIGYAVEYFHIVKNAPRIIAPALTHSCPEPVFQEIKALFLDEHDHDKLLVSSLKAVGIDEAVLRATVALPATFAVYASLGTLARQHFLSFICALDLFEAPYPEFNDAFRAACKAVGLPEAFWEPIVRHAAINVDGEHHRITERLLAYYPVISDEEARVVMINTTVLLETILWQDSQICAQYGATDSIQLRNFQ